MRALGARGRRFESCYPDQQGVNEWLKLLVLEASEGTQACPPWVRTPPPCQMVIVEELVDSPDCESGILRVRVPSFTQMVAVAQLVEHQIVVLVVVSSSLIGHPIVS